MSGCLLTVVSAEPSREVGRRPARLQVEPGRAGEPLAARQRLDLQSPDLAQAGAGSKLDGELLHVVLARDRRVFCRHGLDARERGKRGAGVRALDERVPHHD
eukprot:1780374-Prymnesium_polylepis.1